MEEPKLRQCIKCKKQFKSPSPGHRVCGKCRQDFDRTSQRHVHMKPIVTEEK